MQTTITRESRYVTVRLVAPHSENVKNWGAKAAAVARKAVGPNYRVARITSGGGWDREQEYRTVTYVMVAHPLIQQAREALAAAYKVSVEARAAHTASGSEEDLKAWGAAMAWESACDRELMRLIRIYG